MDKEKDSLMGFLDDNVDPAIRNQVMKFFILNAVTDRERARALGLPEGCRIRENAKIFAQEKLRLGTNVWIGEGAVLDAQGGLDIGDNTQIGLCMYIWSHTSHMQALAGQTGRDRRKIMYRPTKIGSNCFLAGPGAVAPGVTIGNNVFVYPCTFINEDVPDGAVVGTNREILDLKKRIDFLEKELAMISQLINNRQT
ncbi:MAG: acyltransferase [Candidatus Magnetoovum sp. WYHC-5]|nr:acyltransferase [Candidatus Magnetoovum sp. WYHC-5]